MTTPALVSPDPSLTSTTQTALRYRPRTFAQFIGTHQASIAAELQAVAANPDRYPPKRLYLFTGPPGTGKTSMALVFAKALNCTNKQPATPDGPPVEPCNTCYHCEKVNAKANMDGVWMWNTSQLTDAANTIRRVVDDAQLEFNNRYNIVIIDEPQNLSQAAQDSLLEALEDPDGRAIYLFCTTNPDRLTDAIRSRGMPPRVFAPVDAAAMTTYLHQVASSEQFDLTEHDAALICALAGGSVRTALNYLDTIRDGRPVEARPEDAIITTLADTSQPLQHRYLAAASQAWILGNHHGYRTVSRALHAALHGLLTRYNSQAGPDPVRQGADPATVIPALGGPTVVVSFMIFLADGEAAMAGGADEHMVLSGAILKAFREHHRVAAYQTQSTPTP